MKNFSARLRNRELGNLPLAGKVTADTAAAIVLPKFYEAESLSLDDVVSITFDDEDEGSRIVSVRQALDWAATEEGKRELEAKDAYDHELKAFAARHGYTLK